jgi:GNAT superfamily N-acetyltransferase
LLLAAAQLNRNAGFAEGIFQQLATNGCVGRAGLGNSVPIAFGFEVAHQSFSRSIRRVMICANARIGTRMGRNIATISARHDLSAAEVKHLEDRLYDHNRRATGRDDGKGLAFVALDRAGKQIGAIAGYTWAGMAEIKQLWVDEAHRGFGIGRQLLEAAIAEALERRCQCAWVMSYEFQAPGLYEKCGFERVTELKDWPPGHSHFVLRRRLQGSG